MPLNAEAIEVKRGEQWERGRIEFSWEQQDYVVLLALGGTMQITADISLHRPDGGSWKCASEENAGVVVIGLKEKRDSQQS